MTDKTETDAEEDADESQSELASKLVTWFENSETQTLTARENAERDRDYYDNKQLTDKEIQKLKDRGQPVIIINRIKRKVDTLLGIEKTQRTDPKAFPRNPEDEDAAQAATEALRYVTENNNYDQIRSNYWKNLIVEGIGAVKVSIKDGKKGNEILLKRIAWDRFFYDPHSSEHDFSDAKYLGEVIWMDREDARRKWPDHDRFFADMIITNSDTYDDKPRDIIAWVDLKRDRVRIIQTRWRDGDEWRITTSTFGNILKDDVSPFKDEDGKPESDLVAVSAFIDRDNDRYGGIREMISPQDEINKRRSKALHLMTFRQLRVDPDADVEIETLREEAAKPDGVLKFREGQVEILDTTDMTVSQFNLLQESKDEIDSMGANASLQGKQGPTLSGRALLAQQNAGLVELAPLLDRKRDMDIRVYRMIWNRIKQFWTEERWIRITDNERNLKFVGLNKKMTIGEQIEDEFGAIPQEMIGMPELQLPATENGKQIIKNNVGEMDVDIVLDEGPDTITLQSEDFEKLAAIPGVPFDILLELSSLSPKVKDRVLKRISGEDEEVDPQEAAQQEEIQRRIAALQIEGEEANVAKTQAEAKDKDASAEERKSKIVLNLANARKTA